MGWVNHLQDAYFHQQGILQWTLDEDPDRPRYYPNAYKNPLAQITLAVPSGQGDDAERGPGSQRQGPGRPAARARPPSSGWNSVRRCNGPLFSGPSRLLRGRGNDVLVIVMPFNEQMIAEASLGGYKAIQAGIAAWLEENRVPHVVLDQLPGDLYADASHPLTAGYELLAGRLYQNEAFRKWLQ